MYCPEVTDEGLQYLGKSEMVVIVNCYRITDKGLGKLTNCKKLVIYECPKITKHCIDLLPDCHIIFESSIFQLSYYIRQFDQLFQ